VSGPVQLTPYTATETPPQDKVLALKPKPLAWTSRVWRESPGRTIPLFKIDVRIEPREIEDKALAQALRPFAAQLDRSRSIFCIEETQRLAPWAVGHFDVDRKAGFMFFRLPGCAQRGVDAEPDADGRRLDRPVPQRRAVPRRGR
jgi:hypothetical protein